MLEKIKVLKSIEVLPQANVVQVLWEVNIVEDGEVLTSSNHRGAYSSNEKDKFIAEVEGAEKYLGLIEWIDVVTEVVVDDATTTE